MLKKIVLKILRQKNFNTKNSTIYLYFIHIVVKFALIHEWKGSMYIYAFIIKLNEFYILKKINY